MKFGFLRGALVAVPLAFLAGCSALPTAQTAVREDISTALGTPVMPLQGGVYALQGFEVPAAEQGDNAERAPFSTHVVLQVQQSSQSYGMFLHNVRFYEFDGEFLVMEIYRFPDDAHFALARVADDGRSFELSIRTCDRLPENYRIAQDIATADCLMGDARTVLRSLALMEARPDDEPIRMELVMEVPDLP